MGSLNVSYTDRSLIKATCELEMKNIPNLMEF